MIENNDQAMTLRIPVDLHEWLRQAAFDARRTKTSLIVQALEELRARTRGQ